LEWCPSRDNPKKLVLPNFAVPRLGFLTIKAGGEEKPEREEVVEPLEELTPERYKERREEKVPEEEPEKVPPERPRQSARGATFAMLAPMGLEDHIQLDLAACPITVRKANTSVSTAGVPEEDSVTPARLDRDYAPYARMRS
jgi:hypothetical protein